VVYHGSSQSGFDNGGDFLGIFGDGSCAVF
jgi:hypothetical protein